jgi:poly-beta-1,6-N-acetyl-D-glucosamine synthase
MMSVTEPMTRRYIIVSPVRNEEEHLEETIRGVAQQSIRPAEWILVNDGSMDRTANIINAWASEQPWIVPVHLADRRGDPGTNAKANAGNSESKRTRGRRAREAKEIEAFYEGYKRITATDWEFLVKLDGDVGFDRDYFEKCFAEFDADPKLGIGGGVICHRVGEELQVEPTPQFHVRGATKIYRHACWDDITGVIPGAGWDTIDEVKANMLGWSTRSFAALKVVHFRFTGTANGAWQNAIKNGVWSYISGYHPVFLLLRCAKRVLKRPYLAGAIGLLYGFLSGYLRRIPQIEDRSLIEYLRKQQMRRVFFKNTIWK